MTDKFQSELQRIAKAQDVFEGAEAKAKTADHMARVADGFNNFASRVGTRTDNALSASTYTFDYITRNRLKLEAAYRGSWVVGMVVDAVAEDMTRSGINIVTNEADEDIRDLQSAISRLDLWGAICDGIRWGRLYGGAISVINIEGQDLSTPLDPETVSQGQFLGLVTYDRWQLQPDLFNLVRSGPRIGEPMFYTIVNNPAAVEIEDVQSNFIKVHYTRTLRHIGIKLPYFQAITENLWGESLVERLWDRLVSFDNTTMSAAQLVDRASLRSVGVDGLREIIAAGGEAQAGLLQQFDLMRLMQVNEGLTLLDKNDVFQSSAYTFSGLSDVLLQFGQQLSGASGIPLVRFFGQSPAGLSATGESDLRMYYDNINAQQEAKLRAGWDLVLKVLWRSVYGHPRPKDLTFTFKPLWQTSLMDKATIASTNTTSVVTAYEAGLVDKVTAMKELRETSGDTGLFSNITDEAIDEAEAEEPPLPDMAPEVPAEGDGGEIAEPIAEIKLGDAAPSLWQRFKDWVRDEKNFKEEDHPRRSDGKFGKGGAGGGGGEKSETEKKTEKKSDEPSGGGGGSGSLVEQINTAAVKLAKLKKEAKRAASKADTAPDRADKEPKSLALANEKIRAYNKAAEEYNALLDKRDAAKSEKKSDEPSEAKPKGYRDAAEKVSGLRVDKDIPNTGSIASTLTNYSVEKGIKEVPLSDFDSDPHKLFYAANDIERAESLAKQIKENGFIKPLIVVVDKDGPYILEGAHRLAALHILGVKSFPALIVRDDESKS